MIVYKAIVVNPITQALVASMWNIVSDDVWNNVSNIISIRTSNWHIMSLIDE